MIAQTLYLQSVLRPSAHPPIEWAELVLAEATFRGVDIQDHYEALKRYKRDIEDGIEGAEYKITEGVSAIADKVLKAITNAGYPVVATRNEGVEWLLIYSPYAGVR